MKTVTLNAQWSPRPGFKLGLKDIDGKLTYLGSKVWRDPRIAIEEKPIPTVNDYEVLIQVKACGICGSDVHMAQRDQNGYTTYPGLTAFPVVLGHEMSGVVVKAGARAVNKRTGKRFETGEPVCSEEMFWCASCRPCAEGNPNQCEALQEMGFSIDGAFAEYVAVNARYLWSLKDLEGAYGGDDLFLAGSLVEPASVAHNAVIECGGGIRPGDHAVVCGGGPIGLAAVALLKRAGAGKVILAEPEPVRAALGSRLGAALVIDPIREDLAQKVLEFTGGLGAALYLEATGLPEKVFPSIETAIWEGKYIGSTVVLVARADVKTPITGEIYQVKKARIAGAQGHAGYGTFPRVISCMAAGLDLTTIITKKIRLDQVPKHVIGLQTERRECKITCVM